MNARVELPLWMVVVLVLLAAWAALDRLLVPSVRWYLRRRVNRVIDELNTRLDISIRPFQRTRRQVLIDRLLYDPLVVQAAEASARERQMPREVVLADIERYAREIVPAFNAYFYFRLGTLISRRVARLLYRVRLAASDQAALAAVPPESTVVFLMNHRSNMDYVLVAYLASDRTALSYAVGEWARIWPLQTLIRATGAYFVRRNSRDPLYRRVLERYIQMATAAGVTQAVYPEGGLTRDGRLRPPKLGLLGYMLRTFDPAGERDLVFIPVGINYDRTLEDRTLLLDAAPAASGPAAPAAGAPAAGGPPASGPRPRPGFGRALATTLRFVLRQLGLAARSRWHRFGYACVTFGTPISMRRVLRERRLDFRTLSPAEQSERLAALGGELMAAVGAVVPVVPVPLVAAVFVERADRGLGPLSLLELKASAWRRMAELEAAGARVYVPRSDQDYAITAGLRMLTLRHLVEEREGLYAAREDELPLLRYYANSIAHLAAGGPDAAAASAGGSTAAGASAEAAAGAAGGGEAKLGAGTAVSTA
ncbi:MAG TPA: 1-acyl-sn-glycerol-3-phosphate acyltransferase [Thermoanaerobaculia bacterium]|nr:1-acyl-sn-glycerol-3-phosphate acyltransferase [Thermoanaerobaculia bacterium]